MGDTSSTTADLRRRIIAFLESRGAPTGCPVCGSGDRRVDENEGSLIGGLPGLPYYHLHRGGAALTGVLSTYNLVCENCGNIQLFDRTIVDKGLS